MFQICDAQTLSDLLVRLNDTTKDRLRSEVAAQTYCEFFLSSNAKFRKRILKEAGEEEKEMADPHKVISVLKNYVSLDYYDSTLYNDSPSLCLLIRAFVSLKELNFEGCGEVRLPLDFMLSPQGLELSFRETTFCRKIKYDLISYEDMASRITQMFRREEFLAEAEATSMYPAFFAEWEVICRVKEYDFRPLLKGILEKLPEWKKELPYENLTQESSRERKYQKRKLRIQMLHYDKLIPDFIKKWLAVLDSVDGDVLDSHFFELVLKYQREVVIPALKEIN